MSDQSLPRFTDSEGNDKETIMQSEVEKLRALVIRMRKFVHNDAGVVISDTEEFEAIDEEIASLGIDCGLED
jgi:hypothetical protein